MKGNKVGVSTRTKVLLVVLCLALLVLVGGFFFAYAQLKAIYDRQFRVDEPASQITIVSGRMVKSDVIAEFFGLSEGCNLSEIDFVEKRRQILEKISTLRDIRIVRKMPGSVYIAAEEREPTVKLGVRGVKTVTGRVADSEGVVFPCLRGTQMLPVIREAQSKSSPIGTRLNGMPRAALELLETVKSPDFTDVSILEVDASRSDFLVATLADYSVVKICWEGFCGEPTPESRADLKSRLENLVKSIRSQVTSDVKIWNATMPGFIFADTQEKVQ